MTTAPALAAKPEIPRAIWVLVAAAFIIALGYGLIAPVLPQFASSFNVSMAAAGAVISAFALARLLGAPGAGILIDKLGSRPVYLTGLFIVAVATFFVAFAQAYWHILLLRFIAGFGSTMFTLSAQALIVRVTHPSIRGRANALYATSFLLGNIFGPIIGAALSFLGYRIPFAVYGIGVGLAAFVVWLFTHSRHSGKTLPPNKPPMQLAAAWRQPTYKALLATSFSNGFVNMGTRVAILPLFAAAIFEQGAAESGLALTAFALGMAIMLQFSGRLSDQHGRRPMILIGLIVCAAATGVFGMATSFWPLMILSMIAGVGSGLMAPSTQAALADIIGNERSGGKVLSTFQMTQDAGQILAPILVGWVAEVAGFGAAFGLCGALLGISLVTFAILGKETATNSTKGAK
ncbi:Tetracycline resistance protein, class C [Corynebacterium glaucum]|uniref:Tetracycline resistance protein, class C n=1 Tax=Corynebacterium glaucum TaxID=187491 RepID=A0A1Q2HVV5_9CORY|nr:MFS transporter [Corynebacterium glaucum]AQQ14978.1 Tetracycline resistance protein, class C [Corynebacterium glaucum]